MSLVTALVAAFAALSWPGSQPHLATLGDRVYLTFADEKAISVVRSDDRGTTFRPASKLPVDGTLSLGMRRGPRIAATQRAVIVAAIVGKQGGGTDGDVVIYRSMDRGKKWQPPVILNDVSGAAREGLHSIAANPRGVVAIVWLDLRATGTKVYAAVSRDHGATWGSDTLVYASPSGSVCECCQPTIAIDEEGSITVMFRNNVDGARDMYLVRSRSDRSFGAAVKISTGTWKIDACPMDGGALEIGADGASAVWRREKDIYLTTVAHAEHHIARGRQPVIGRAGAAIDLAWTDQDKVFVRPDGRPAETIGSGRFPAIASLARRAVVAWEGTGTVELRVLDR